ncbi:hypothetical protein LTR12_012437 [Friedmanniomyces endolithicus]|nr:hypothetical protein LTR74_007502 [Friedmanniomyces endolithicus]KAK1813183.1 hypothetical protein LTR12_012437 [Friedmanniomyces endolithicus]
MATTNGTTNNTGPSTSTPQRRPTVCVFCGASPGTSPSHLAAARALAHVLYSANLNLVYGGGTVGIMGEIAKTLVALSGPNSVHGIIPKALLRYERSYIEDEAGEGKEVDPRKTIDEKTYGRTTVVRDMHTRKQMMAQEVSDGGAGGGFVSLSGGYGTLEETMEMVTWNQLGIHAHPVVLFDVDGYWEPIIQWVRNSVGAGFIAENNAGIMVAAKTAEEVLERLRDYQTAEGRFKLKWNEK